MRKNIFTIMLLGTLSLSLLGCSNDKVVYNNDKNEHGNRFVATGDKYKMGWSYYIYYDNKTKIVYLIADSSQASGITVVYNKDGKPMTIDEYNSTK